MSAEFFGFNTTQAKTLERLMGSDDAGLSALATAVSNLNAWATATATLLNAETVWPLSPQLDTNPQA